MSGFEINHLGKKGYSKSEMTHFRTDLFCELTLFSKKKEVSKFFTKFLILTKMIVIKTFSLVVQA